MTMDARDPQDSDLPAKIGAPARRALAGAGLTRLDQLTRVSESELKRLHGMGPKAIETLRAALDAKSMSFAAEK